MLKKTLEKDIKFAKNAKKQAKLSKNLQRRKTKNVLREEKNIVNDSGITLIALIFTIVALVVLSTATIIISLQNEGLIYRAYEAKDLTQNAVGYEEKQFNELDKMYSNLVSGN